MNKVIEIVLALVIIGATLAFGGVERITYSLMEVTLFLAACALLVKQTRAGRVALPLPVWPLLFLIWAVLEVIPLPSRVILMLSPARLVAVPAAVSAHGQPAWATLSIYPHDTLLALLKFSAYLSGFLLAAYLFDSRKGKSLLLHALLFLGVFEAAYGIFQYLTGWQKIFGYAKQYDLEEATGTYINRNHFAGLLELTVPFALAAAFYYFQMWSVPGRPGMDRRASARTASRGLQSIFYVFLTVIMVTALLFSRSRMGIMAAVLSLIVVALLAQIKTRRKAWMLILTFLLACIAGYALWIGLNPVLARFEMVGREGYVQLEGREGRFSLWQGGLRLMRDYPLTGTGMGTFGIAYRRYQTTQVGAYVDHAHNDYIEFASEVGLPGAALLLLPLLYLFAKMLFSFFDDRLLYRRAVTLGCIGSTLGLLMHSFTDFNLQIPANALILAVVLGVGYKAACVERRAERVVQPSAASATAAACSPLPGERPGPRRLTG